MQQQYLCKEWALGRRVRSRVIEGWGWRVTAGEGEWERCEEDGKSEGE